MRWFGVALVCAASAGCVAQQREPGAAPYAQYLGMRMSRFMAEKGRAPDNAVEAGPGRRTFFFTGDTVVLSSPAYGLVPAVSAAKTCRVVVETSKQGSTGSANDWRVESVTPQGPCGSF